MKKKACHLLMTSSASGSDGRLILGNRNHLSKDSPDSTLGPAEEVLSQLIFIPQAWHDNWGGTRLKRRVN